MIEMVNFCTFCMNTSAEASPWIFGEGAVPIGPSSQAKQVILRLHDGSAPPPSSLLGNRDPFALHRNVSDLLQAFNGRRTGSRRSQPAVFHRIPKRFILDGFSGTFHRLQRRSFRITLRRLGCLFFHFGFLALHQLIGDRSKERSIHSWVSSSSSSFPFLEDLAFFCSLSWAISTFQPSDSSSLIPS